MICFKNFMELTRGYSLLMTFASCIVIYSFAHYASGFCLYKFALILIALCCVHMFANLYDDYRDVKKQLHEGKNLHEVSFQGFRPKARLIINNTFSLKSVKMILAILASIALIVGIYFAFEAGWPILIYMALGIILTLLYPISSRYYCAEIIVGLIFGPLMIMGGYYALTECFDIRLLLLSFAIFFTTVTLLHTHSIMDWEFDVKDGKKTIAILSGSKENAIKALAIIVGIPYFIILLGVLLGQFNPNMLFVFLTLPITTKLISSMREYIYIKDVEFKPRWYWGIFENWKTVKENKLEFFMFRFYLARNYSFFFAIFAAIGVIR